MPGLVEEPRTTCLKKGNPIEIATGDKVEQVVDYTLPGARPFEISRTYRSSLAGGGKHGLGYGWSFDHDSEIWQPLFNNWSKLNISMEDGAVVEMNSTGSTTRIHYESDQQFDAELYFHATPTPHWILEHGDGRTQTYSEVYLGNYKFITRLKSIDWPDGYHRSFEYVGDSYEIAKIADSLGRSLYFTYDNGAVTRIETSDGVTLDYEYDHETANGLELIGSDRLIKFTKTTAASEVFETNYHYENTNHRYGLTGITDARGIRYATWDYDVFGRGILSEHSGGAERVTFAYDDITGERTVTNAVGKQTVYGFDFVNGRRRLTSVDGVASTHCAASNTVYTNTAQGDVSQTTDAEGNITTFEYNARNLQTRRVVGYGSAEARTIDTQWHATLTRPTLITTPELETAYSYDASGLLTAMTQTDNTSHTFPYGTNGEVRSWSYNYTQADPVPLILESDNLSVLNAQFDFPGLPDWITVSGAPDAKPWLYGSYRSLSGQSNVLSSYEVEQTVAFPSEIHGAVDANGISLNVDWLQKNYQNQNNPGAGALTFLDAAGAPIGAAHSSPSTTFSDWTARTLGATAPVGARQVKISFSCTYNSGTDCDASFENVELGYETLPGSFSTARPALLSSVDGPLPGVSDKVSYEYDAVGNLAAVVNELGHRTEINTVNAAGQPTEIEDPNGLVTTLEYDGLNRLTKTTVYPGNYNEAVTEIEYDEVDQITRIDFPHQPFSIFEYDNARRLTAIENAIGERREFTYDLLSNVTMVEDVKTNGVASMRHDFQYDELGRMLKSIGASSQTADYDYDRNDNLTSLTDPRSEVFNFGFDALNRLISETDPDGGITAINLRSDGATADIEDAENLSTTYVRNGWGDIIETDSPDTGVTEYIYDARGLVTEMTDARSQVATYAYDAAGRILSESFTGSPSATRTYGYDSTIPSGNKGVGRLTSISDGNVGVDYIYDLYGRVSEETKTIAGPSGNQSYVLNYAYIADGRITNVTYPSGRVVKYSHDVHGSVGLIRMQENGSAPLIKVFKQVKFVAMSGAGSGGLGGDYGLWSLKSGLFENGLSMTVGHDLDGRASSLKTSSGGVSVLDLAYAYDANSNITSITDNIGADRDGSFQYDSLNRLTQAAGLYGTIDYAYDLVGNRTALTRTGGTGAAGLTSASYSYGASSHRLQSVSASTSRTLSYLASGQMSSDVAGGVTKTYAYDSEGRMIAAYEGGVLQASYDYDAFGRQVSKTEGGSTIHLIHDPFGRLIAEHNGSTGATIREYIYLGLIPVAMIDHSSGTPTIYYIHTDQVAQPQVMTDATGAVVWDRVATPFNVEVIATGSLTNNIRFPGQLEDSETSLFQNWNRDYDPLLGRYVQSDPIGLLGGINTYAYVEGNPLSAVDSNGLIDVFIGGAFDRSFTGNVRGYASDHRRKTKRNTVYFGHRKGQRKEAMKAILDALKNNPCEPVNIIGHSFGGASAGRIAKKLAKQGIQADLVVTVDPVGRFRRSGPRNAKRWVNINARDGSFSGTSGDLWAQLGGKWGDGPADKADRHYRAPYDHEDFGQLMEHQPDNGLSALDELMNSIGSCTCNAK